MSTGPFTGGLHNEGGAVSALTECVIATLTPYVGPTVADTCVRATALSLGKTTEDLEVSDLPSLEANVRRLLGPVAPSAVIDQLLTDIERSVA
jgi:hypothetical protein